MSDVLEYRSSLCRTHRVFHDVVRVLCKTGPITTIVTATGLELAVDMREGLVWAIAGGNEARRIPPGENELKGRRLYLGPIGTDPRFTRCGRRTEPTTTWERMEEGTR